MSGTGANIISSTGVVTTVQWDRAWIESKEEGKVLLLGDALRGSAYGHFDLIERLHIGDHVRFVAVPHRCVWLVRKAEVIQTDTHESTCGDAADEHDEQKEENVESELEADRDVVDEPAGNSEECDTQPAGSAQGEASPQQSATQDVLYALFPITELRGGSTSSTSIDGLRQMSGWARVKVMAIKAALCCFIDQDELVICPFLTWTDGNNGDWRLQSLDSIVPVGTVVFVKAVRFPDGWWRAISWSLKEPVATCDSQAQTVMTREQMMLRAIGSDHEVLALVHRRLPHVFEYLNN